MLAANSRPSAAAAAATIEERVSEIFFLLPKPGVNVCMIKVMLLCSDCVMVSDEASCLDIGESEA